MSYASDKLYDGYLRKNMGRIVSNVKPREIIVYLPCLTDHDIESIETKNDFSGKYEAMKLLLSCMKRRESWPEQFIDALEKCEHRTIAAEIRAEYNKLRGINNSSPPPPAPPASNVVTAHVHPAPSAPHLPDPVSAATGDVPSQARETNPIQETETPAKSTPVLPAAPVVEVTTPPEPPQTQTVVVPPATPPPSTESTRDSTNPSPPPEQVDFPRQEPEENLEPDEVQVQDVPNETVNIPEEVEENAEVPPAAEPEDEPCEIDDSTPVDKPTPAASATVTAVVNDTTPLTDTVNKLIEPEPEAAVEEDPTQSAVTEEEDALTTTSMNNSVASSVEVSPARSLSPMTNLDDLNLTLDNLNLTSEKPPVQETSPKEEKVASVVPVVEDTPEPQNTQTVETVQAAPSPSAEVENGDRGSEDEDICFSKPGVLMSAEPPDQNNTTIRPPSPDSASYSGDSARLEMSKEVSSQENGISHKQQSEDVSESPALSLDGEDVEESIGHVAEEPSILNKETQALVIENSVQPAEEIPTAVPFVPETTLISDPSCCDDAGDLSENLIQEEEQPSLLNQESQTALIEETEEQAMSCPTESPAPSLDMEDVRENVGHVAEEPSILNLDVQQVSRVPANETSAATVISDVSSSENVEREEEKTSNQEVQTPIIQVNGEPTKEIAPVPPKPAPATNDNNQPNDPPVDLKLPDLESGTTGRLNRRHILTAAGVGACALLIAWRLKH